MMSSGYSVNQNPKRMVCQSAEESFGGGVIEANRNGNHWQHHPSRSPLPIASVDHYKLLIPVLVAVVRYDGRNS